MLRPLVFGDRSGLHPSGNRLVMVSLGVSAGFISRPATIIAAPTTITITTPNRATLIIGFEPQFP